MNFTAAAKEAFEILRGYDYELLLFNDERNQVFEPEEARRFFAQPENLLVSIHEKGEDSGVHVNLSKSTEIGSVMGLLDALRAMTTKYKGVFHVRKHDRDLSPKDFSTESSMQEGQKNNNSEVYTMKLVEGMYGTSRSSYLKLENARMIVRHSAKINENVLGARGRNIDAIYIENALGERHLFSTTQLAPARAMVHHVDNGGSWADSVGEQISRMASDFAACGSASRHIGFYGNDLTEAAQEVRENLREHLRGMRRAFESFQRKTKYAEMCEHFSQLAAEPLTEGADEGRIAELASLLNTEAVQLSEAVLGTVARVLEANAERKYHAPKLAREKDIELTHVLNHPVAKAAWEAFKNGKLELIRKPDIDGKQFADERARQVFILREIARSCKDDGMANLLSWASSEMQTATGKLAAQLAVLRKQAMVATGLVQREPAVKDVAKGSAAVQEHIDWINSFSVSNLMEFDRFPLPDHSSEDHNERVLQSVVDNFDYDHFMTSSSARDFHYDVRATLDDEESAIDFDAVVHAVEHFLETELSHQDVTGMHVRSEAETLAAEVASNMTEDGYTVLGAPLGDEPNHADLPMAAEDLDTADEIDLGLDADLDLDADLGDDLDIEVDENCGDCPGDAVPAEMDEDILLPKSQENDLIGDTTKATVVEPQSGEEVIPDSDYISRLMTLAGRR